MSRFVTLLFHIVPRGRLVRAALSVLVCALGLLAAGGAMPARAASVMTSAIMPAAMGPARDTDRAASPSPHADGATLDLDDVSRDGRFAALSATDSDRPPASLGRRHADDGRRGEVDVPLPERPPRG